MIKDKEKESINTIENELIGIIRLKKKKKKLKNYQLKVISFIKNILLIEIKSNKKKINKKFKFDRFDKMNNV